MKQGYSKASVVVIAILLSVHQTCQVEECDIGDADEDVAVESSDILLHLDGQAVLSQKLVSSRVRSAGNTKDDHHVNVVSGNEADKMILSGNEASLPAHHDGLEDPPGRAKQNMFIVKDDESDEEDNKSNTIEEEQSDEKKKNQSVLKSQSDLETRADIRDRFSEENVGQFTIPGEESVTVKMTTEDDIRSFTQEFEPNKDPGLKPDQQSGSNIFENSGNNHDGFNFNEFGDAADAKNAVDKKNGTSVEETSFTDSSEEDPLKNPLQVLKRGEIYEYKRNLYVYF